MNIFNTSHILNEYGIEIDKRFKRGITEAKVILSLFCIDTIWVFGFAIWGLTTDLGQTITWFGMPNWLAFALLGAIIIYPLSAILIAWFYIRDCPLDPYE